MTHQQPWLNRLSSRFRNKTSRVHTLLEVTFSQEYSTISLVIDKTEVLCGEGPRDAFYIFLIVVLACPQESHPEDITCPEDYCSKDMVSGGMSLGHGK